MSERKTLYSAAEQNLGYIYQARFALLKILSLPENNSLLMEKDDDIEVISESGARTLSSLKHKAVGDRLTNLSTDFWKSVRVWLAHYHEDRRILSETRFILFTTATVTDTSFLRQFLDDFPDGAKRASEANDALAKSESQLLTSIRKELGRLNDQELEDFFARITIVDANLRITEIPKQITEQHLRTIRKELRQSVFERLEGWWMDTVIKLLSGERAEAVLGYEVSDKLSALAEEYKSDNLPITFRTLVPKGEIDAEKDPRLFVEQLRVLELSAARIRNAIIDYYRAFEQRSSWARESLLISGEIEEYESRLVDEWMRYKEVVFEAITNSSTHDVCKNAGKELYKWAELQTTSLRIRERVTEPYVIRGTFHILANERPNPKVYWHPRFLDRLREILEAAA